MNRIPSLAALALLLCGASAPAAWAASPEEERLLGCGCEDTQLAAYMPYTRTFSVSGQINGSLARSTDEVGVPPAAMLEALSAFGAGLDLARDLRDGDRFYVRYERNFTADGNPMGIGRVLWAELRTTAKGVISIHRFRPLKGDADIFFLSTGQTTATPELRLPLDTISVSSGFGIRANPFDQPFRGPRAMPARPAGGPEPKPSPLTNPAPAANPMTQYWIKPATSSATRGSGGGFGGGYPAGTLQMHEGVDLAADLGTPIHAAGDGVILGAELKGGYGNWIEVEHEAGPATAAGAKGPKLATVYGHLSAYAPGIAPGVRVTQGQVIGFVGSTGRSTGPHLHFEILVNGRPTNPMISLAMRRETLKGGELVRFKQKVARDLQERQREAGSI